MVRGFQHGQIAIRFDLTWWHGITTAVTVLFGITVTEIPRLVGYAFNPALLLHCEPFLRKFIATRKLNATLEQAIRGCPGSGRRVVFGPATTWFLWYLFGDGPQYSTGLPKAIDENVKDVTLS